MPERRHIKDQMPTVKPTEDDPAKIEAGLQMKLRQLGLGAGSASLKRPKPRSAPTK